ncbi:Endonuclease/exonuclease/phosphatase [Trema orientale]|uniref:Endonuclease/exonuclease/phosphatase n=1 Tax=Trema orientale TaxID=63057 RepID=A0A2P5FJZ0_TREOI|nr:Endonuclease/exonuclease/phosphatase [Trema orientale]
MLLWKDDWDVISPELYSKGHIDCYVILPDGLKWRFTDCQLSDLGCSGPLLTWNNRQDGVGNIQERLDRFVCDSIWMELFSGAEVENCEFSHSDHCPTTELWGYEKALEEWSWEKLGRWRIRLKESQKKLERLYGTSPGEGMMAEIRKLEKDIEILLYREEAYWKQWSRADWLVERDRNTKYFHNKASNRKKKNSITKIRDRNGCWVEGEDAILPMLEEYFNDVFQSYRLSVDELEAATRHNHS